MLTAAQIVTLACQMAKCPGYTSQAGQLLNTILSGIAIDQNLDIIRRTATINITPGVSTYSLPATYLRSREMFYNVEGAVFYLIPIDISEFDQLFTGPNSSAYPEYYAINIADNTVSVYPQPLVPLSVTLRYMDSSVEITTPETSSVVPWFQKQDTLITMLAEQLMRITDDTRQASFFLMGDESLRRYLKLENGETLKTVQLDPRRFRGNMSALAPTKLYP